LKAESLEEGRAWRKHIMVAVRRLKLEEFSEQLKRNKQIYLLHIILSSSVDYLDYLNRLRVTLRFIRFPLYNDIRRISIPLSVEF